MTTLVKLILYITNYVMKYPQDFEITYSKKEEGNHTIDSYKILQNIIREIEITTVRVSLGNSLPIILGDIKSLTKTFKDFLLDAVDELKDNKGILHIIFREDLDSSFLCFFVQDQGFAEPENDISSLVNTVSEFNLAFCKKILTEKEIIVKNSSEIQLNICISRMERNDSHLNY